MIKKPKKARNSVGELVDIQWPVGRVVAKCGDVYMIQNKSGAQSFQIVYGLEVKPVMDYHTAATQFGFSVMHQATCEGLLKL